MQFICLQQLFRLQYTESSLIYLAVKVLLIGATIFLVGSALCGVVTSMEQLIFFRALQGIGAGAVMPITMTIIGDLYSEAKDRAKAQGWMSAVWGVSGVIGPLVGGFLVDSLSWRYIFLPKRSIRNYRLLNDCNLLQRIY